MAWTGKRARALMMAGAAWLCWPSASRALEPVDFNLSASPQAARAAPTPYDDEDEDAFFSSSRRRNATGTVATIGQLPASVAVPRPTVDVVATCRAVLADNLNHYNYNFIEGCQRAVRSGRR